MKIVKTIRRDVRDEIELPYDLHEALAESLTNPEWPRDDEMDRLNQKLDMQAEFLGKLTEIVLENASPVMRQKLLELFEQTLNRNFILEMSL